MIRGLPGCWAGSTRGMPCGRTWISFDAAQRLPNGGTVQDQNFEVLIDSAAVEIFKPGGADYATFTTTAFNVTAGSHTIEFLGLDSIGGDNTAFIDAVKLTQVTTDHLYYSAQDQVIEERVGGTGTSNVTSQYVWVPAMWMSWCCATRTAAG